MGGKKTSDRSKVLEFIKASKVPVGKAEVIKATGFDGDFPWCMHSLMNENEEIEKYGTKRLTTYLWKPKKPLYSEMKNAEGYPDPTAGKAMANAMKSDGKYHRNFKFGEIYACSEQRGDQEGLFVISSKSGTVVGLNVYPEMKDFMNGFYTWHDERGDHFVSPIQVVNVKERNLTKKMFELDQKAKEECKDIFSAVLGLQSFVETKVAMPVEVIKEVPVKDQALINENAEIRDQNKKLGNRIEELEKQLAVIALPELRPVEYRNDPAEIEAAVMKTKIEIYERLIFGDSILKSQVLQAI